MFDTFQIVVVLLVALVWATVVAHALELPGKMRLDKETYFAVQRIYYPGFTIAGIAEFLAVIATACSSSLRRPAPPPFGWCSSPSRASSSWTRSTGSSSTP